MSHEDSIRIAFVCVENAGRSRMAAAFAERERDHRGMQGLVDITCGGTQPAERVHDSVAKAMAEVGINLADRTPREITPAELEGADMLITMGWSAEEVCPATWRGDARDWTPEDPRDSDSRTVREVRDEIRGRVKMLLDELESQVNTRFR